MLLHKTAGKENNISIVTLEPTVVMLARVEKPEYVNEGCIPSVSCGKGVYVGNNYQKGQIKYPILAMSWGNVIELFEI